MGWLCFTTPATGYKSLEACHAGTSRAWRGSGLMARGTLVLETHLSGQPGPQSLLGFDRPGALGGRFSIQSLPTGGVVLVDALGDDIRHSTLTLTADCRIDVIRITYSWDAAGGWGRLTLEHPASETLVSQPVTAPLALPREDLIFSLQHLLDADVSGDVVFVALSDEIEPVGPMPALTSQVPILTRQGEVPAAEVKRGDIVITNEGYEVPVLQVVSRTVPAFGSFQPVRLRAPYFGLTRDIVVAPAQRLVLSGTEVDYMFGREAVLVPARHLINDRSAFYAKGPDLVTYHHLLLSGHEALLASGASLESLYIGRMRRQPDALAQSVLSRFDRTRLPEHAKPIWPVLKPFEAVTLATMRAA